jgi:hypothetical protein
MRFAKEIKYMVLDLKKRIGVKAKVLRKITYTWRCKKYKLFNPAMTLKEVEKYSQGHLHGQQVAWNQHLEEFGSSVKHLSCPIETCESLCMW